MDLLGYGLAALLLVLAIMVISVVIGGNRR